MASMLLDEQFVAVFPSLVRRLGGMNEAAVLQTIHYASQLGAVEQDGRLWVPLTCREIGLKTGLSEDAVLRCLTGLRESGVVIGRGAQQGSRKLMWSIDMEVLEGNTNREIAESPTAKSRKPNREIAGCTTTKNREETTKNIPQAEIKANLVVKAFVDEFEARHRAKPDKASIGRMGQYSKRLISEGGYDPKVLIEAAQRCARLGHVNLPAALMQLIAKSGKEPRGFAGIREFLEDE